MLESIFGLLGHVLDWGSVFVVGMTLAITGLGTTGIATYEIFKARHNPLRMGKALAKMLILVMFVAYPIMHFFIMLNDTVALQLSRHATNEACKNDTLRNLWDSHTSSEDRCKDSAKCKKWMMFVWLPMIWERGAVGLYLGLSLGEMYSSFVNTHLVAQIIPFAIAGAFIYACVAAYVTIKVATSPKPETPEVYRKGDEICWKMPGGEEQCSCIHEEKVKPESASGPSE